jgi:spore photoproduct lyase
MHHSRSGTEMIPIMETETALSRMDNHQVGIPFKYKPIGSSISMEMKPTMQLDGSIKNLLSNIGDGSIITLFDKTPFPTGIDDVVCPHFVELKWANGCNFDCAWCYLNGTFRFRPCGKKPFLKDREKVISHIERYLKEVPFPTILNSGELSDSLAFEGTNGSLTDMIVPLFKSQDRHKLLVLTKSANVDGLLSSNAQKQVVTSFSVNALKVSSRWERKAPPVDKRLEAAIKLRDAGYRVRLRIDPMVPVPDWKRAYKRLVDKIFDGFVPERITLGSLRGLQSTINHSKDKSWVEFLDDRSNWGKKIGFPRRAEMYRTLLDHMEKEHDYTDVGLCKETIGMWEELGKDYKKIKCNCLL